MPVINSECPALKKWRHVTVVYKSPAVLNPLWLLAVAHADGAATH